MGLKATIDNVRNIDTGIYMAHLEPDEASSLGECSSRIGPYSIIVLEANMTFSEQLQAITFDPSATRVLNVGTGNKAVIINGEATQSSQTVRNPTAASVISTAKPAAPTTAPASTADEPPEPVKTTPLTKPPEPLKITPPPKAANPPEYELSQPLATGDKLFLSELPPDMRGLGEKLLSEVRKQFPGELSYEPRSGKFDETPEIFWTVKIHPHDKSLRLTVRGNPELFPDIKGIDLKADKFGYSVFVLSRKSQIEPALIAIKQGAKNMMA